MVALNSKFLTQSFVKYVLFFIVAMFHVTQNDACYFKQMCKKEYTKSFKSTVKRIRYFLEGILL